MLNEMMLDSVHTNRELSAFVKRRKKAYFGHFLRADQYKFLNSITKGKIEGKTRNRKVTILLDEEY